MHSVKLSWLWLRLILINCRRSLSNWDFQKFRVSPSKLHERPVYKSCIVKITLGIIETGEPASPPQNLVWDVLSLLYYCGFFTLPVTCHGSPHLPLWKTKWPHSVSNLLHLFLCTHDEYINSEQGWREYVRCIAALHTINHLEKKQYLTNISQALNRHLSQKSYKSASRFDGDFNSGHGIIYILKLDMWVDEGVHYFYTCWIL